MPLIEFSLRSLTFIIFSTEALGGAEADVRRHRRRKLESEKMGKCAGVTI